MEQLPPTFEKDFLELLQSPPSAELLRVRRTVSVISFFVVAANLIGLSVHNLSVYGTPLREANKAMLLAVLLSTLYFAWLTWVYQRRDKNYRQERAHLLDVHVAAIRERIKYAEGKLKLVANHDSVGNWRAELETANAQYEIYNNQQGRTEHGRSFARVADEFERIVPYLLATAAIGLLSRDLILLALGGQ